jgi:hypothetical protein
MSRSTRTVRTSAWLVSCFRPELGSVVRQARLGLALSIALGFGSEHALALGESGPLVVVISNSPDAPFVRRLAAELSLFGYRVEVASRPAGDPDLPEVLARAGGAALIAVDQGQQTAEVIVAERAGMGLARRELERLDPRRRADTNAAVLAERFRARLTELGIAPGAEPELPPLAEPERAVSQPAAPEPERRLWVAGAFGITSGGLGAVPDASLEVRAFPVRWLSTSAFGKLSLGAAKVRDPAAEADVRLLQGGVLIDAYPVRGDLVVMGGLGAMLVNAAMSGRASAPLSGRTDSVLVPAGMFEAGAGLRLSTRVTVELRGFVGACSPRIGVRFAGRNVAQFGQPLFGASLGLAVGVF